MNEQTLNEGGEPRTLLDKLIRFCLENKLVVALVVIAFIAWGIGVAPFDWDVGGLPRSPVPTDAIPDIGENQQIVFTEWMGRSPQDVQDQITYPLTVSLLGLPGVKTVRSFSFFGFSSIYVIFDEKVDFYWSRTRVLEKLNSLPAGTLPEGVQPALGPDSTALGQIFWYTLEGRDPEGNPAGGWDPHELRTIQDWSVRYALLSAAGISEVASVGGFVQEYQIDVDPDAMRAFGVTLEQVFMAVRMSNVDVGARTIEVNKVEYVIRGLGFIKDVADIEDTVVRVADNVPVYIKNIGHVSLGPALRRGALDKDGGEATGGVVVVRYGFNPLAAIKNVKAKIAEISPGLPAKAVVAKERVSRAEVERFAREKGFDAYDGAVLNQEAWLKWLRETPRDEWPRWVTTSQVTVVPFYDRTGLIYETLGTLNTALIEEILVTIIVVLVGVMHLRSSLLISGALPLAVLMAFIAMKLFGVDANIVALSGIAIAIGTIVDMSIIICENILRHLEEAPPSESRLEVVYRACSEVGGAVLTAVLTTVVGFLPVFAMSGAEGKLFKPLAFTKTFALIASIIVALTIVPPGAHLLFTFKLESRKLKRLMLGGLIAAGVVIGLWLHWWLLGGVLALFGLWYLVSEHLPQRIQRIGPLLAMGLVAVIVGVLLTRHWEPLGPQRGPARNLIFVGGLIGGLLLFFYLFRRVYAPILRWCLAHKVMFLIVPLILVAFGLNVWLGPRSLFGPLESVPVDLFAGEGEVKKLADAGLLDRRGKALLWTNSALGMGRNDIQQALGRAQIENEEEVLRAWSKTKGLIKLREKPWGGPDDTDPELIRNRPLGEKIKWTVLRSWNGLGKEFMPPLDEGSFLYMPTTMPHASIGEALDVLSKQDMAFRAIPEIDSAVGKLGRAETPLDPAPVSMIETVINYKPEYVVDKGGRRLKFAFDPSRRTSAGA